MTRTMFCSSLKKSVSVIQRLNFTQKVVFFLSIILLSLFYSAYRFQAQAEQKSESKLYEGHESHTISLQYAVALTRNFRHAAGNNEHTILGEYFGKDALIATLNQERCTGLRIYYGKKDDGTPALVLIGVDQSGSDMTTGLVLEFGFPCPPYCDTIKALTSEEIASSVLSDMRSANQPK